LRKDEKTGKWIDVGDKKAAEKTSQALREKATEEREKVQAEGTSGAPGILVPMPTSYSAATTANVMGNILASGTFTGSTASAGDGGAKNDYAGEKQGKQGTELAVVMKSGPSEHEKIEQPFVEEVEV
jgi:hypothetical protein